MDSNQTPPSPPFSDGPTGHETPMDVDSNNNLSSTTGEMAAQAAGAVVSSPPASPSGTHPPTEAVTATPRRLTLREQGEYLQFASNHARELLNEWVPHQLSADEYARCRAHTHHLIQLIHDLEDQRDLIAPAIDPQAEMSLFLARVEYRATFGRIFRFKDLPNEIICNIFHYVSWTADGAQQGNKAKVIITSVCKLWRKVAIEDPTLWNTIWFKDPEKEAAFQRALTWFERAADAPKDIRISDGGAEKPMLTESMQKIIAIVSKKWASIRILVVVVHHWNPALMVLASLQSVAHSAQAMVLQRFELHRTGSPYVQIGKGYEPDTHRLPLALFGGASIPSLSHFSLNGVYIDWEETSLANLTVMDLRRISLANAPTLTQFRRILTQSPMLRKLILDGAGPSYVGENGSLQPVALPSLKVLVLVDFSSTYGTFLLSQMSAPNVRDLTLMNLVGENYGGFFAALVGTFPDVKILTLYNSELHPIPATMDGVAAVGERMRGIVIRWLASIPSLAYLRIGSLRDTFLNLFLTYIETQFPSGDAQGRQPICPQLSILEWQSMDAQVVCNWMESRKKMHVPIKRMYLGERTAAKIDRQVQEQLAEALVPGGDMYLLRTGHKAPEEAMLMDS